MLPNSVISTQEGETLEAKDIQERVSRTHSTSRQDIAEHYQQVRRFSEHLCEPLVTEDYAIQSMPDVSPTKVYHYRRSVDQQVLALLEKIDERQLAAFSPIITFGLNHEQQHQELILTDIKHVLSCNPLCPTYVTRASTGETSVPALQWASYPEGISWIGHEGESFLFDNEEPRHRQFLHPFQLSSRLITNGEYLEFMEDGGYRNPLLWLSDGWNSVQQEKWNAPLYWEQQDDRWWMMTLSGWREVDKAEPVCHVSYYEADAYARWADARLPTEAEWETAASGVPVEGNFVEQGLYHPAALTFPIDGKLTQMYGDVWEWTQSPYTPYPCYKPAKGAVGEYNGKFMCNQFVLRGGSCATCRSHIRSIYRNFFPPNARWQFMGIRLAKEV